MMIDLAMVRAADLRHIGVESNRGEGAVDGKWKSLLVSLQLGDALGSDSADYSKDIYVWPRDVTTDSD